MSTPTFNPSPDLYDALIDWPRRLANEAPFYRTLFRRFRVHTVLDAACGTGRHAAMFRDWGLLVEGADASADMIARAQHAYGTSDELRWAVRPFDTPPPARTFDAAICVGNSLALADDLAAVERTVIALLSAVRPAGLVVLHLLNLWRLPDGPVVWQKTVRTTFQGVEHVLIKGVHRSGRRGFVELLDLASDQPAPRVHQAPFIGLSGAELDAMATQAGAAAFETYGDYRFAAFDEPTSEDLIAILRTPEVR